VLLVTGALVTGVVVGTARVVAVVACVVAGARVIAVFARVVAAVAGAAVVGAAVVGVVAATAADVDAGAWPAIRALRKPTAAALRPSARARALRAG
jgi:hypothetical protein